MRARIAAVLLAGACVFCAGAYAQRPAATGGIAGVVMDPAGAVVAEATVELRGGGVAQRTKTSGEGRFVFAGLAAGRYAVSVGARGFAEAAARDVMVTAGEEAQLEIVLRIGEVKTDVEVKEACEGIDGEARSAMNDDGKARNAAELLEDAAVSLRTNGELASMPMVHGLGDERTKVVVDGMTVSAACGNHMNPPLSYMEPGRGGRVTVMAGITPVSAGGDSVGGTVTVETAGPEFAGEGERLHAESDSTGLYASNGERYGGAMREWVAGRHVGMGYAAAWEADEDYRDGSGHKVTSTYAQRTDQTVTLAARGAGHTVEVTGAMHHVPYEGFVNAQMDLVRNLAESVHVDDRWTWGRGRMDAHAFWQGTWHGMNVGRDKGTFPMAMWMPMQTHGRDVGYGVRMEWPATARQTVRAGNELHRFVLDDRWPAVAGTAPYMGPNEFVSVNDGRRLRVGTFAELESRWNARWTTLAGVRSDMVWMNAGPVQGYSGMYGADAAAFNAAKRGRRDADMDATALVRFEPTAQSALEAGYARKTRAPNLYERYAWSTNMMASGMIGWFGDGNYYVGDVALKPEIAQTVSGTVRLGGAEAWQVKVSPYWTRIENYVDVDTMATVNMGMSKFAQLRFANGEARLHGVDFSGNGRIWEGSRLGTGTMDLVGAWLHGERRDTRTGLYQMMPLHARVRLEEAAKGWSGGVDVEAVDRKRDVDPHRYEQKTPGYALLGMHAGYARGALDAHVGVENVLNREYALPLGGVNMDDFMAGGWMGSIGPVTGRGRGLVLGLSARF